MFQIDLNRNLQEEPEYAWICRNMSKCVQILLDKCKQEFNFVNMSELPWNITCLNRITFFSWTFSNKVQNIHKLLWNSTWITCLKPAKYLCGSKYNWISHGFWICLNIHEYFCARILNMPESSEIYPNAGRYVSICLMLWIWLNMPCWSITCLNKPGI